MSSILYASLVSTTDCTNCAKLSADVTRLREQLREVTKLAELQNADLQRLREAQPQVNRAERAPADALQLAFDRILVDETKAQAETPVAEPERVEALAEVKAAVAEEKAAEGDAKPRAQIKKKARPHGRRTIDLDKLPQEVITLDPDPVIEAHGEGYECIGVELGRRLASRPASLICLVIERPK
jgi:hypothetical protein